MIEARKLRLRAAARAVLLGAPQTLRIAEAGAFEGTSRLIGRALQVLQPCGQTAAAMRLVAALGYP